MQNKNIHSIVSVAWVAHVPRTFIQVVYMQYVTYICVYMFVRVFIFFFKSLVKTNAQKLGTKQTETKKNSVKLKIKLIMFSEYTN